MCFAYFLSLVYSYFLNFSGISNGLLLCHTDHMIWHCFLDAATSAFSSQWRMAFRTLMNIQIDPDPSGWFWFYTEVSNMTRLCTGIPFLYFIGWYLNMRILSFWYILCLRYDIWLSILNANVGRMPQVFQVRIFCGICYNIIDSIDILWYLSL